MGQKAPLTSPVFALAMISGVLCHTVALAADGICRMSRPVTGGELFVSIQADGATVTSVSGTVELYTARVAAPLGFRDGTYHWNAEGSALARNGAILGLNFEARLPLSEMPAWGGGEGNVVPIQLRLLLPILENPLGAPVTIASVSMVSGNGIYNSNNRWSIRTGDGAMMLTNAPEPLSPVYSRELLQLISNDPNEPLSVFVTPAVQAPVDSIVSFHSGGLLETPALVQLAISEFIASEGTCRTRPLIGVPQANSDSSEPPANGVAP